MGVCKAPHISYLSSCLLHRKTKTRIQNCPSPNFRNQSPKRRLLLFSLPLSGFLLLPNKFESASSYAATQYDPVTPVERDASAVIAQRVSEAVKLLEKGRELQAQGDFNGALAYFSRVIYAFAFYFAIWLDLMSSQISLFRLLMSE